MTGGDDAHVHLVLDDHYASKLRSDGDALREKHQKTEDELEEERRQKLELATAKAELSRNVEELTAFLKQAHAALEEERNTVDKTEVEMRSGLEATFVGACALLRTKAKALASKNPSPRRPLPSHR